MSISCEALSQRVLFCMKTGGHFTHIGAMYIRRRVGTIFGIFAPLSFVPHKAHSSPALLQLFEILSQYLLWVYFQIKAYSETRELTLFQRIGRSMVLLPTSKDLCTLMRIQ